MQNKKGGAADRSSEWHMASERIIILSLIKMERMKLQCFGVTSEEIRYRRIGNERRIPFAFWPSSQKCLHRTLLIVLYRSKQLY